MKRIYFWNREKALPWFFTRSCKIIHGQSSKGLANITWVLKCWMRGRQAVFGLMEQGIGEGTWGLCSS